MTEFICDSPDDTRKAAEYFARSAEPGSCFALFGDLGCGKTTFSRYFIQFLNESVKDVPSPSFTIVRTYDSERAEIRHVDCHRLKSAEEFRELGLEEAMPHSITLVEWPEIVLHLLPESSVKIRFLFDGKVRTIIADRPK
jgi:tRNA threonylcarbamoyl adenosine modification protein YjeE